MAEEQAFIELVRKAQQGREDSMNRLAERVKARLSSYIYRVTLDQDLTQDLSQEALLTMVKSIDCLNRAERFWPWLYRIAQSKIQQYYRAKQKKAAISASISYRDFVSRRRGRLQEDGLHRLLQKELSKKVVLAIKQLRQQYRAVLALRCFEQLSYPDIAVALQCSEVKARVLFFRAKQALKKQLTRQGLSSGMLLTCLGVFGKLTAPADAASATVTVSSASAKVGLTTAVIATAGTKFGLTTALVALVGFATVGGVRVLSQSALPKRADVRSAHYTVQARNTARGATASLSKGAYEQWYYFPEGVDGPVFMRMQRWDSQQKERLCAWLQNDEANYYFESGSKQVYVNNYRLWLSSGRVRKLPTDEPELTKFLSDVEGGEKGITYEQDKKTGLLVDAVDDRFVDAPHFRTIYNYNTLDASLFEYSWPANVPVVDQRDPMHKRGWTYFQIDGEIGGRSVSGRGRIPFVYRAYTERPPWMTLRIGDELRLTDCSEGAALSRTDYGPIAAYPAEAFFDGLGRPWMGMHTVDVVRRDAANRRVWFEIILAENGKDAVITLTNDQGRNSMDVIYTIDMENDILKAVAFKVNGRAKGSLTFSYLQDVDQVEDEFVEPAVGSLSRVPTRDGLGMLWLVQLAQGNLGQ